MIILGIDPGSTKCGFAIVQDGVCLDHGTVKTIGSHARHRRLRIIGTALAGLAQRWQPGAVAMEIPRGTYRTATLALGECRGIAALVTDPAPVFDYGPSEIKKAATGKGVAGKDQMRAGVSRLFGLDVDTVTEDGADALAVAWLHWTKIRSGK